MLNCHRYDKIKQFYSVFCSVKVLYVFKALSSCDVGLFTGLAQLDKNLVSEINEYYLLHGTKPDLIAGIVHDGLDFRMSSDEPMFGRGAYCAESSTKADQYAGTINFETRILELKNCGMFLLHASIASGMLLSTCSV